MNSSQAGPSEAAAVKTFGKSASGETREALGEASARTSALQPLSLSEVNAPRVRAAGLGPAREGAKDVVAGAGVQRDPHDVGSAPGDFSSGVASGGAAVASTAPERVHGDSTGETDAVSSAGGETTEDPRQVESDGEGGRGIPAMPALADDAAEALAGEGEMAEEIEDQEEEPTYEELKYQLYDTTNRLSRCTVLLQRMVDENEALRQELQQVRGVGGSSSTGGAASAEPHPPT